MEDFFNKSINNSKCAVIVAHPDDETLWTGGTILMNPLNDWTIITICRKSDSDRSIKFSAALKTLNANGEMGDLDDGPEQLPLDIPDVEETILSLLKRTEFDLIMTHSTQGEYTRHRRHEEVAEAVIGLIESKRLKTKRLWMFAYTDNNGTHLPKAIMHMDKVIHLPSGIWKKKYEVMTETYGFSRDSWEARTTPRKEAFWTFNSVNGVKEWIKDRSMVK
jgi:LmbE family N-acetylglucosaminyl deacetylase